jgi:selenocysteine lyase/cysteine desulfurase
MPDWTEIARSFPVNERYVWLNSCGIAPAPTVAAEAVARYAAALTEHGVYAPGFAPKPIKDDIQGALARLLECQPHEVALVRHTSEAMNLISHGLELEAGDDILLLEKEYPSNVYPWQHWSERGVELRQVPLASSPAAFFECFEKMVRPKTRVAALSAVHWCTGMRLPIDAIARLCEERNILLVLDLAQAAGHVRVDIRRWRCCAAFSAWKWLLGPLGLGVLVVPDQQLSLLRPVFKGTESVVNDEQYLPYKDELKPTAERYMYSTNPMLDWVYFRESLKLLERIGFEAIFSRLLELAAHLRAGLRRIGYDVPDYGADGESAIVVASKRGWSAKAAAGALFARGIIARERDGRLRLAPHVFLTFEQLDEVVDALSGDACLK